ncbi:MAG: hypothetical protein JWN44_196 [Myxococcales bacterium]|nr:hypothetical protein [Myxococcales bacterium]
MFRAALLAALFAFSSAPARAEEPEFEVVGKIERAALSLSILPRPGYRILGDAPVVVRLDGSHVDLPRRLYRREDAVDPHAEAPRFEIALKNPAGGARIDAELTFYICRAARCRPVTTRYGTNL